MCVCLMWSNFKVYLCVDITNMFSYFQCVYIAPLKALVRERMEDWKVRIEQKLGKKYGFLSSNETLIQMNFIALMKH